MESIATPVELVTSVAEFRFSPKLNAKLQDLMDRNTEGNLSAAERDELEALVELSETIALLRRERKPMQREYTVVYQVIEDDWIMATAPELPGAVTQGKTITEARAMIKEAVALLLESYREHAAKEAPATAVWETLTVEIPST